jgi:hypothetical protein
MDDDWIAFVCDETSEIIRRRIVDDEIKGEIRAWPDGGVHWWIDLDQSGHWGLADDVESAIGMIDLIREAML